MTPFLNSVNNMLISDVLAWLWPGFGWPWPHIFQAKAKPLGPSLASAWPGLGHGFLSNFGFALAHQEKSIRLAGLAPDMPDTARLPYLVWRHNDGPEAIKFSCPRT